MAGMTPFMASIEAAKRAFGEAETAQRRRHRAERTRKDSDRGGQDGASTGGVYVNQSWADGDHMPAVFCHTATKHACAASVSYVEDRTAYAGHLRP